MVCKKNINSTESAHLQYRRVEIKNPSKKLG